MLRLKFIHVSKKGRWYCESPSISQNVIRPLAIYDLGGWERPYRHVPDLPRAQYHLNKVNEIMIFESPNQVLITH